MRIISDLHLHSKYARGCSKDLNIQNIERWSRIKGIDIIGSGDFTHPKWINEIKENLTETDDGILKTKNGFPFILTSEISLIYTDMGKVRKIHNIVWAPNLDVVSQITEYLSKKGRIDYDGRPIFKIPSDEFVYELRKIDSNIEIIPAHIWTPWFSLYGANSGYDSIKDCFKDQEKNIHAIETGMSSDPSMNWRIEELKNKKILSFSDSHSYWPWRLGREATIFELKDLSYKNIIKAIRSDYDEEDQNNVVKETIEVDPGYGKYHFTGHRNCKIVLNPVEAKKLNNICPVCKKKLTIGVLERVEELANHNTGFRHINKKNFFTLIPLSELISGLYNIGVTTKKTWNIYNGLIKKFGSEFNVLLNAPEIELRKEMETNNNQLLLNLILDNRAGNIRVKPGFDGVYGVPLIFGNEEYDFENSFINKDKIINKDKKNNIQQINTHYRNKKSLKVKEADENSSLLTYFS